MNININPEAAHTIIVVCLSLVFYAALQFLQHLARLRGDRARVADLDRRFHELANKMVDQGKRFRWESEDRKNSCKSE
jgi:hypothetical protein